MTDLKAMMARHAQTGRVTWIGVRSGRRAQVQAVDAARIVEQGLEGDHGRPGKRAVTLIQAEHLPVIAALLGRDVVPPEDLRRNVAVAGINLAALKREDVRLGDAVLRIEGPCPPCSRMEETFGAGGYSAVRGHGGWYASVISGGDVAVGDRVALADGF
ncbi:MOSC domain-containing protein [Palleronia abyssalis]|uniref:MOSC domain-containing protein n=1 Tax=Palleronia abyssalis TaxID=1501240 RepID=A0A2R8BWF8_9RHOB|nr:MOSC domain-containing protein [Palleronia abyssalis]SPJ24497.1 hypothetical protein PAA8504_02330 [Palleronia abyssalis]